MSNHQYLILSSNFIVSVGDFSIGEIIPFKNIYNKIRLPLIVKYNGKHIVRCWDLLLTFIDYSSDFGVSSGNVSIDKIISAKYSLRHRIFHWLSFDIIVKKVTGTHGNKYTNNKGTCEYITMFTVKKVTYIDKIIENNTQRVRLQIGVVKSEIITEIE